ncbi:hypothetical protein MSPP1_001801 [Malassezia sp. CBS 17886]|nr:hypothetical protein MSPP1_001801 [Malassezia sp. CBS 17886]
MSGVATDASTAPGAEAPMAHDDASAPRRAAEAYNAVKEKYYAHTDQVQALQATLLEEAPQRLRPEEPCAADLRQMREFLDDRALLFRFLRRARFDREAARLALLKTLQWRLEGSIDDLPTDALHSPYMSHTRDSLPLFWVHSRVRDRLGRPCLYVRMRNVERMPEGLHDLKKSIIASLDVMRRYLQHVNRRTKRAAPVLQCAAVVDVQDMGMVNFELELLPFLVDLLKNHYPGMVGSVYVLNYGWLQAGLWRMVRPMIPPKLLSRILFLNEHEACSMFDQALPRALGGAIPVSITSDTSDVFNFFARSAGWRAGAEPPPADADFGPPSGRVRYDYESIYDVMSRMGSPYTSRARTPSASLPGTPRLGASSGRNTLHLRDLDRLPAALQRQPGQSLRLERADPRQAFAAYNPAVRTPGSEIEAPALPVHAHRAQHSLLDRLAAWVPGWYVGRRDAPRGADAAAAPHSAAPRDDGARTPPAGDATPQDHAVPASPLAAGETPQPARHAGDASSASAPEHEKNLSYGPAENIMVTRYLSWRAHKYAQMDGHVSPYNIENPYFGYPAAYVDTEDPNDTASTTSVVNVTGEARMPGLSRPLRVKRRKRDLLRTLTYLFMLRLLSMYRQARRSMRTLLWGIRSRERVAQGPRKLVPPQVVLIVAILMSWRVAQSFNVLLPLLRRWRTTPWVVRWAEGRGVGA